MAGEIFVWESACGVLDVMEWADAVGYAKRLRKSFGPNQTRGIDKQPERISALDRGGRRAN